MITFEILYAGGAAKQVQVPEGISLNLMEVLKASEYPVAGTCGGMALCATCHIEVLKGGEHLDPPTDIELDMLDTLPSTTPESRLACQIRVNTRLQHALVKLAASDL